MSRPSLPPGHPERVPRPGLALELQCALHLGEDDTVAAILAVEEAAAAVSDGLDYCGAHRHEYHRDDGCRDCT